jgi:hypothetical protein
MIFRVLDLAVDVDPSQLTVKFSGPSLEILARKARGKPRQEARGGGRVTKRVQKLIGARNNQE